MEVNYSKFFPIKGYYEKVLSPINSKFKRVKNDKFICCLHDDNDPSLGIIHSKGKGEIFHCFGCHSAGNVIALHKRVSLKYFKKVLDDDEAKRELCNIFNIKYDSLPVEDEGSLDKIGSKDVRKEVAMRRAMERYDLSDFNSDMIAGKMEGKGVPYFNTLLVRVIAEGMEEDE